MNKQYKSQKITKNLIMELNNIQKKMLINIFNNYKIVKKTQLKYIKIKNNIKKNYKNIIFIYSINNLIFTIKLKNKIVLIYFNKLILFYFLILFICKYYFL